MFRSFQLQRFLYYTIFSSQALRLILHIYSILRAIQLLNFLCFVSKDGLIWLQSLYYGLFLVLPLSLFFRDKVHIDFDNFSSKVRLYRNRPKVAQKTHIFQFLIQQLVMLNTRAQFFCFSPKKILKFSCSGFCTFKQLFEVLYA